MVSLLLNYDEVQQCDTKNVWDSVFFDSVNLFFFLIVFPLSGENSSGKWNSYHTNAEYVRLWPLSMCGRKQVRYYLRQCWIEGYRWVNGIKMTCNGTLPLKIWNQEMTKFYLASQGGSYFFAAWISWTVCKCLLVSWLFWGKFLIPCVVFSKFK